MKWLLCFGLAFTAQAHVISMSSADLRIEGNRATWSLRIPIYEIQHVRTPEHTLLANVQFTSQGVTARIRDAKCAPDTQDDSFKCTATLEWPLAVEELHVKCTFHAVTVPNHVHLLRATLGDKTDQAIFDFSQTEARMRFKPPTPLEVFTTAFGSGFARTFAGGATVLFLACLALAARTRREFLLLGASFFAGETIAAIVLPLTTWSPAPRFVEAAMALTIGYLAVEILLLPTAGQRWLVAAVLGGFHGLGTGLYNIATGYNPALVLSGLISSEMMLLGVFGALFAWIGRKLGTQEAMALRVVSAVLLVVGLGWFFVRLRT